jgi:uncharacterized protein YegL
MYSEARKLHLIGEVLKVDNEATLSALEALLKNAMATEDVKLNIRTFSGIWMKGEADEIERIIEESCESINPDNGK